ncbi:MAG: lytic transglycosylase domain-containing protein [Clostridia bacterium]|nr:lytic transglycosylase domain-containing protein [Clostridia bacterium]
METPTPTPQRNRRADRYKQESGIAPSPELLQRTAPPSPAPAPAPLVDEAPPPPMARPKPAPRRQEKRKLPLWITASIIALLILLLALLAAQNLMQAYIVQQQNAREAAYQRIVDNHPIYFKDLIDQYAAENNLQPAFVAAIILNESSFRTDAESSVGARGLMQLMPDTAEWISGKLGDSYYSFDHMWEAEQNIRYGCWYLNYLSKLFRGDPVTMASAYHAGQTTVTGWLSDPAMSPDGLSLSLSGMKDGPTKTYAGRVTQAYAIYDALFYQTAPAPGAEPAASVQ